MLPRLRKSTIIVALLLCNNVLIINMMFCSSLILSLSFECDQSECPLGGFTARYILLKLGEGFLRHICFLAALTLCCLFPNWRMWEPAGEPCWIWHDGPRQVSEGTTQLNSMLVLWQSSIGVSLRRWESEYPLMAKRMQVLMRCLPNLS